MHAGKAMQLIDSFVNALTSAFFLLQCWLDLDTGHRANNGAWGFVYMFVNGICVITANIFTNSLFITQTSLGMDS